MKKIIDLFKRFWDISKSMNAFEEARMASITSERPDNIGSTEVLVIDAPCEAAAVFNLLIRYPNIKQVRVGGMPYTRQHISNMGPIEVLGRDRVVIEAVSAELPAPTLRPEDRPLGGAPAILTEEESFPGLFQQVYQASVFGAAPAPLLNAAEQLRRAGHMAEAGMRHSVEAGGYSWMQADVQFYNALEVEALRQRREDRRIAASEVGERPREMVTPPPEPPPWDPGRPF